MVCERVGVWDEGKRTNKKRKNQTHHAGLGLEVRHTGRDLAPDGRGDGLAVDDGGGVDGVVHVLGGWLREEEKKGEGEGRG